MANTEIFLTVEKGCKNHDTIECQVPFRVNDEYIFYGGGNTAFRKDLRKRYLRYDHEAVPETEIYVVGVNDLPAKNPQRKVIWIGKMIKVMTFAIASRLLDDPAFESLEEVKSEKEPGKNLSPLHLHPLVLMGNLSGYIHRSDHNSKVGKDGIPHWVKDVMDPREKGNVTITKDQVLLEDLSQRTKVFNRDCCFLCENLFFAQTKGIEITDKLIEMLDEKQPGQNVDNPGIFGYKQGRDGKTSMVKQTGAPLHIRWNLAERMIDYLMENRPEQ